MKNPNALINSDYGPVIVNINDYGIGRSISVNGFFSKNYIDTTIQLINFLYTKMDHVVLYDIGANIGTYSLAISKIFNENITIKSFEAQRKIFYMMCGTFAVNGLDNIHCYNLAVGEESDTFLRVHLPDYSSPNNFGGLELIPPLTSDNQAMIKSNYELVKTTTVDSFNEKVDFLKIDVEGMEDKVIQGASQTIKKNRPICLIETLKTNKNFIFSYFKEIDYSGYLDDQGNEAMMIPSEYGLAFSGAKLIF